MPVAGDEFFAAKISTESAAYTQIDWRRDYDSHTYEIIDTPEEIRSAAMAYMTCAGLASGLPIADAIARLLLKGAE